MFCSNCGSKIVEGNPFCITCGQAQPSASASKSVAPLPEKSVAPLPEKSVAPLPEEARPPRIEAKGFFASLFDFGFTSFITLKFLRVIYGVVVVLILLTSVLILVASLSRGGIYAVFAIVIVPIVTLIYLVLTRVSLEIVALFFRIGENTSLMVAAANRAVPAGEAHSSGLAGPFSAPSGPH